MSLKRLVMQLMTNLRMKQQKVLVGENVVFSPLAKVVNEGSCIVGNNVEIHSGSRVEIQGGGTAESRR